MSPRFRKGQKVIIVPVKEQRLSARDADLRPYAGQNGTIANYHWLDIDENRFYIYTVLIGDKEKEVVVHEDELAAHIE